MVSENYTNTTNLFNGNFKILFLSSCILLIPVYIFGIVANIFLISTIVKNKRLHTPSYFLSVNMALSDIMVLTCSSIYLTLNAMLALQVQLANVNMKLICQINTFTIGSSYMTSSLTFAVISIDRYFTMYKNRIRNRSPFKRRIVLHSVIMVNWLIAFILSARLFYTVGINSDFPYLCDIRPCDGNHNYLMSIYHIIAAFREHIDLLLAAGAHPERTSARRTPIQSSRKADTP